MPKQPCFNLADRRSVNSPSCVGFFGIACAVLYSIPWAIRGAMVGIGLISSKRKARRENDFSRYAAACFPDKTGGLGVRKDPLRAAWLLSFLSRIRIVFVSAAGRPERRLGDGTKRQADLFAYLLLAVSYRPQDRVVISLVLFVCGSG